MAADFTVQTSKVFAQRTSDISPDDFKPTDLGDLPAEWEVVRLGDLFTEADVRVQDLPDLEQEIPILSMTRYQGLVLQSQKFDHRVASRDISKYKVVKFGQLVYSFPIDEGVIAILHRYPIGAVSPAYPVWELKKTVEADLTFLDALLKTPPIIATYRMFSSQTVHRRRNLSKTDFKRVPIPFPPLNEQRKIAHVLNSVQQAIAAQADLIVAAQELKRSLLRRLFTYGPGPEPAPTKETEIGEVPTHWEVATLNDVCEIIVDCPHTTPKFKEKGVLVARNFNIRDGRLDLTRPSYTSEEEYQERIKRAVPIEGDVLFSREAPIGEACLIPPKTRLSLGQRTMLLRTKADKLHNAFLIYTFYSDSIQRLMESMATGVTAKHLNVGDIRSLEITLPPLPEQHQIAHILQSADAKIAAEQDRQAGLQALFNSLLQALMTGRLRVKGLEIGDG